jgi:hypothetical protein
LKFLRLRVPFLTAGRRFNYLLRLLGHDDVDLLPAHEFDHRFPLVDPLAAIVSHHSHRVIEIAIVTSLKPLSKTEQCPTNSINDGQQHRTEQFSVLSFICDRTATDASFRWQVALGPADAWPVRPCHRKQCRVEESDLDQERRLIPIDVLVRDVTSLVEAHHYDVRQHTLRPVGATPGR